MSQLKRNQGFDAKTADSHWKSIYRIGGAAALIVAALFLIAIIDLLTADLRTGMLLQDNFLVLIFKLHAGFSGVQEESLEGLNLLDITIVVLVGTMSLSLYPALKRVNKTWAIIAASLPFIGLALYFITNGTGRSGVIGTALIISVMMLWSDSFSKHSACLGILASIFLFAADAGTAIHFSNIFAISMGIGYVFFLTWCILVALRLFQLGSGILGKEDR